MVDETKLVGEFDAKVWAREFVATVEEHPDIPTDGGTMIGWFAAALMAGYDRGRADERRSARMSEFPSGEGK